MKDFSIVVPIYNVEEYLDECLASVQAALPVGFDNQVICVNDGSTDSSASIAQQYADNDPRFQIISQINGGYGKAINTGMNAATGQFVTIVESDDIITPGAYEALLEILQRDDELDFVKTPYQPFTSDGPLPKKAVPPSNQRAADILAKPRASSATSDFLSDSLIFEPPAIWSAVYRQKTLKKYNITLPETPGAGYQDTCFAALCFLNRLRYHWVDDRYYMYRIDRESASRHIRNRRREIIELFRFIKENLQMNGNFDDATKPYFYAVYFRRLFWFMQRVRSDYQFPLFIASYRDFHEVWEDRNLFDKIKKMLPGTEKDFFQIFHDGRFPNLYID